MKKTIHPLHIYTYYTRFKVFSKEKERGSEEIFEYLYSLFYWNNLFYEYTRIPTAYAWNTLQKYSVLYNSGADNIVI